MGEKNKNYQRIEKLIIDTFIDLCKNKKSDSITVSMICKEADINRTTFYNHYKDIWQIIEVIEYEIMIKINKILDAFKFDKFVLDPDSLIIQLNDIILEKPTYYQKLYEISESKFFIDKLKNKFKAKLLSDPTFLKAFSNKNNAEISASFFVGGLANLYSDWFSKNIECSLEEMVMAMGESIRDYLVALHH
ncbi:MAG: TetR/AcrR family transcriptional regulator [Bacilli bacterium]